MLQQQGRWGKKKEHDRGGNASAGVRRATLRRPDAPGAARKANEQGNGAAIDLEKFIIIFPTIQAIGSSIEVQHNTALRIADDSATLSAPASVFVKVKNNTDHD